MKKDTRILAYVMPTLAAVVLTASAAIAQLPGAPGPQRGRAPASPEQRATRQAQLCDELEARQAARFTYIEERLKLTAAQKPLFASWKAAAQDRATSACAKPRAARDAQTARPTFPERNARMEDRLKTRLAALEKIRGPQEALYNALSADQKAVFERSAGRPGMMRGAVMRIRATGQRLRGRFGAGFGGRGPGGPGFGGPGFGGPGRGPRANSPT